MLSDTEYIRQSVERQYAATSLTTTCLDSLAHCSHIWRKPVLEAFHRHSTALAAVQTLGLGDDWQNYRISAQFIQQEGFKYRPTRSSALLNF